MQEAQRVQGIQMSEAQRLQQADIAGKQFMFSQKERRQSEQLDRKQAQITGQAQAAVAASQGASAPKPVKSSSDRKYTFLSQQT